MAKMRSLIIVLAFVLLALGGSAAAQDKSAPRQGPTTRDIAERVNALIAPTLNYGVTPAMKAFPGAVSISEETYAPFAEEILGNLADNGFRNIIVLNGHAGNNETAYIQAVAPDHIHPERYKRELASPNPPAGAYYAVPVTSTIGLYEKGQGHPTFDSAQAKEYFRKVNDRVAALILDTIKKWDSAGVFKN